MYATSSPARAPSGLMARRRAAALRVLLPPLLLLLLLLAAPAACSYDDEEYDPHGMAAGRPPARDGSRRGTQSVLETVLQVTRQQLSSSMGSFLSLVRAPNQSARCDAAVAHHEWDRSL